jgi:hypothetical protein
MLDWLTAIDDMLIERWAHCMECGAKASKGDFLEVGSVVMAVGRCLRCYEQDPDCLALCARLEARLTKYRELQAQQRS